MYFWQNDLLLITVTVWLLLSAIIYGVFLYWPSVKTKRESSHTDSDGIENVQNDGAFPERLKPQDDWSNLDNAVWDDCCQSIEIILTQEPHWQAIPDLALAQLAQISTHYHGETKSATLNFTVPELLLVVSIASNRYREMVIEYVPYIDKISVANANSLLNQKDNIATGYSWFNRIRRTARLINPASAVVGELRELITDKVFTKASDALQNDMKRLLLQEVAQVGIDLYSGKLSTSERELASYRSRASSNDEHRQFDAAEPLRILLIGQSSTGKSSLINALANTLQAEVGALPVTNQLTVHKLQLDESNFVSLVDTPGIDGSGDNLTLLLEEALQADLIIWLAKATQPAREPDRDLYAKLQAQWTEQQSRLRAPIIMGLTHIDQLSPKSSWQPPYDLSGQDPKASSIVAAIESAVSKIAFPNDMLTIPLYLGEKHDQYNVDALAAQIVMLTEQSLNVQRNRRRLEYSTNSASWSDRWSQAKKLGKVLGQSIVKSI